MSCALHHPAAARGCKHPPKTQTHTPAAMPFRRSKTGAEMALEKQIGWPEGHCNTCILRYHIDFSRLYAFKDLVECMPPQGWGTAVRSCLPETQNRVPTELITRRGLNLPERVNTQNQWKHRVVLICTDLLAELRRPKQSWVKLSHTVRQGWHHSAWGVLSVMTLGHSKQTLQIFRCGSWFGFVNISFFLVGVTRWQSPSPGSLMTHSYSIQYLDFN